MIMTKGLQKLLLYKPGDVLNIAFDVEVFNVQYVTLQIEQYNGTTLLESGTLPITSAMMNLQYPIRATTNEVKVKIIRDGFINNLNMTFFIDNFIVMQQSLEIISEKHFYPFGLQHHWI